jgi:hypothetical protein
MTNEFYISKGSKEVFYTLRKGSTSVAYTASGDSYMTDSDEHICILAQDLDMAIAKAKALTGFDCEYNPDSLGRRSSWNATTKENEVSLDLDTARFNGGKYSGRLVLEMIAEDLGYVIWFNDNAYGAHARAIQRLLRNLPLFNDAVAAKSEAEKAESVRILSSIVEVGNAGDVVEVEVTVANVRLYTDEETHNEYCTIEAYIGDVQRDRWGNAFGFHKVVIEVDSFKKMEYRGMPYAMPVIDGKAKKLKGKIVKITATIEEYHSMIVSEGGEKKAMKIVTMVNPTLKTTKVKA